MRPKGNQAWAANRTDEGPRKYITKANGGNEALFSASFIHTSVNKTTRAIDTNKQPRKWWTRPQKINSPPFITPLQHEHEKCCPSRHPTQTVFTGTLIVVPDSSALARVGEATVGAKPPGRRGAEGPDAGVTGLKKMGVKELTYRSGNEKTQSTFWWC